MKKVFLVFIFLLFFISLKAQETNCGDGIDNDGDGFIDCFDNNCSTNSACEDSYIGRDKLCQAPPELPIQFGMTLAAQSANQTSLSYGRFVVGDLDGDGLPEVVTTHRENRRLFILNGTDLSVKYDRPIQQYAEWFDLAIGNINNDNCARIFIAEQQGASYYITSFDCTGTQLWRVQASGRPYTLGLADFDNDGLVELYYRNEILDAHTGVRLVNGIGDWNTTIDSGPVAVDILDNAACTECAGLELVVGGQIYAVDLNPRNAGANTLGAPQRNVNNIPNTNYFPKYTAFAYTNSQTSVADFNLDGHVDVLMNGATGPNSNSPTTIFFWDVFNNTVDKFAPTQVDGTSWNNGAGRLNVADIDGDGQQNVTFVSGSLLFALDNDFSLMWTRPIFEATSGFTSTTVFDFNNDGAVEVVYRDEQHLYIIDGETGNDFANVVCKSRTSNEYPIVVDVDGDGATEICVTCNFSDAANVNDANQTIFGHIRMFKSSLEPWVPSRKVWNQHAYFNVNVNDDLSIPRFQQQHHLVFAQNACGQIENRPLNTFLNQSAILDSKGCPTYPAPDLSFVANPSLINLVPPTCPEQNFTVSFSIQNTGDQTLNGSIPVTFYSGDPQEQNAVKLNTFLVNVSNFGHQDVISVPNVTVNGTGGTFTLFVVLNDNGSGVPTPITPPYSNLLECNYDNNIISVDVSPAVFNLTTEFTSHIQCNASATPNGSAEVYRLVNGVEQTVGYSFYWFDGVGVGDPANAVYTGPERQQLSPGTYSVFAQHDAFGCVSAPTTVTIGQATRTIAAQVTVDHNFSNCFLPDGALSVAPADGVITDYGYQWFEGTIFGTSQVLSTGNTLINVEGKTYSVLVTETSTGCETIASGNVPDVTVKPTVSATPTAAGCNPPNSGSASANVNGSTAGFVFHWYNGTTTSTSSNFTGSDYLNINAGNYTVVATDNATGCSSNPFVVQVASTSGIIVPATVTSHLTSCANTNGAASANVGGLTDGFTFQWFTGQSTVNQIGNSSTITGLSAGTYTVMATSIATGCTDTEEIIISDLRANPAVVPTVLAHQTHCAPPNGQVTASANGTQGPHVFYWFNGNVSSPDTTLADFKGATYTGRAAGLYTVVAVQNISRCYSARQVVQVNLQVANPVIATNITDQTSCDAASPNGGASASVNNITIGYKFRWFSGVDTTNFIAESQSISGRPAGAYVVKAQNRITGCESTSVFAIQNLSATPTLSLMKTDNSICDQLLGYSGSATANLVTNPNGTTAHTYFFSWSRNGVPVNGVSGSSLLNVDAGIYEVSVTNQSLSCTSPAVSIQVLNNFDLPDLMTGSQASTNCISENENGFAEVISIEGNSVLGLSGYSYQWHLGNTATDEIELTDNATANQARLVDVQGGAAAHYTVRVSNLSTGCESIASVLVPDAKVNPQLSVQSTPNTICDPSLTTSASDSFNGSVTASILNQVGGLSDYTFIFNGGMNTGQQNGNNYSGLNGGATAYTVSAIHNPTGCSSAVTNFVITNNFDLPTIATSASGSTNCVAGKENGTASVTTVDGNAVAAGGYGFMWSSTQFSVVQNPTNTSALLEDVQGGSGFDYTVVVTNLSTGCVANAITNVPDLKLNPQLQLSSSPNIVCDPSLASSGNYSGDVTVVISNQVGSIGDYIFNWSTGATGAGLSTLVQLNHGSYSVDVVHDPTGCTSSPGGAQVLDNTSNPTYQLSLNPSQNCAGGSPDGSITVTGLNPAGTFSFQWFDGNTNTGPVMDADAVYENIQGGASGVGLIEYTVEVTDTQTGCMTITTTGLGDDSELPQNIQVTTTPNTFCVGANGTATMNSMTYRGQAVTDLSLFNFQWSAGVQSPPETISQLSEGSYTLTVTNVDDNCISNPVQVTIIDNIYIPQIAFTEIAQSSCDVNDPNGQLTAGVIPNGGGLPVSVGYTFVWEDRGFPYGNVAIPLASLSVIDHLAANRYYEVTATDQVTGCENTASHLLAENIVIPVVNASASAAQTFCSTPNGSALATITNPNLTPSIPSFTFYWLREQPLETTTLTDDVINNVQSGSHPMNLEETINTTTSVLNGVAHGNYAVVVRDDYTTCVSQPAAVQIEDLTYTDFNIQISGPLPSDCNATGVIEFSVSGNANNLGAGPFNIDVFAGGPIATIPNQPIDYYSSPPNPPQFQSSTPLEQFVLVEGAPGLTTRASGLYTFVVEDQRGCRDFQTYFLPFLNAPGVLATVTNVTNCTVNNGEVEFRAILPTVASPVPGYNFNQSDYTFTIYNTSDLNNPVAGPFIPVNGGEDCIDPADNNGNFTGDNQEPDCIQTFAATGLPHGFYVLEITDNVSSCPVQSLVEIVNIARPAVVDLTAIGNSSCDLTQPDGSIALAISQHPLDAINGITYTVDRISPNMTTEASGIGVSTVPINNLAPGSYEFEVTSSNGCVTQSQISLPHQPRIPQLSLSQLAVVNAEYCDQTLEQSARISVNNIVFPDGANELLTDYHFAWFGDATLISPILSGAYDAGLNTGADELDNQDQFNADGTVSQGTVYVGDYFLQVTKLTDTGVPSGTGGLGCVSAPLKVDIEDSHDTPQITLTPSDDTGCNNSFEGSIESDIVTTGPGSGAAYNYAWVQNGNPGAPASRVDDGVNDLFLNLENGNYSLTATNLNTLCMANLSATVDVGAPPIFTVSATIQNVTLCNTFDGEINSAQVFVDGVQDNNADFDIVWFGGTITNKVLDGEDPAILVEDELTSATYPGIDVGNFLVQVIRKSGGAGINCQSAPMQFVIDDDRIQPQVNVQSIPTSACDDNHDGQITVSATTTGAGAGSSYDVVWMNDPDGVGPISIANRFGVNSPVVTLNTDVIGEAVYSVRVTNTTTACFTDVNHAVTRQSIPLSLTSVGTTPVEVCSLPGNGSATVNTVTNGLVSDYTYTWANNSALNNPFAVNDALGAQSNLNVGNYYVRGLKDPVISPITRGISASGCTTSPFAFSIEDHHVNPTVDLVGLPSTSCDDQFDGQITVTSTTSGGPGAGANYDITWLTDPDNNGVTFVVSNSANAGSIYTTPVTDKIGPGNYSVRVTNLSTACFADASISINQNTVPFQIVSALSAPQQLCSNPSDGQLSVSLNSIEFNGNPVIGSVTVSWYNDQGTMIGSGFTQNNVVAGQYSVTATRTTGVAPASGCVSAPFNIQVDDLRMFPNVTIETSPSTVCDTNFDGSIILSATTAGIAAAANYNFQWISFPANATIADVNGSGNYSNSPADVIAPGNYEVQVTNLITGCSTLAEPLVLQTTPVIEILRADKNDQYDCNPADGSIMVDPSSSAYMTLPGNYIFTWRQEASIILSPLNNGVQGLVAANYSVTGLKIGGTGSGCTTSEFPVVVNDHRLVPVIELTSVSNSACNTNYNGEVHAAVSEGAGLTATLGYTFEWFSGQGTNALNVLPSTAPSMTNIQHQVYTVRVTDISSPGLNCVNDNFIEVPFLPTAINADFQTQPQSLCAPLLNGSATINSITQTKNGISTMHDMSDLGQRNSFFFQWFDSNQQAISQLTAGEHSRTSLPAGVYYAIATNALGCPSTPIQIEVDDETTPPQISLDDFRNPQVCVLPETSGFLQVSADNSINLSEYTFTWYNGEPSTNVIVEPDNPVLANIAFDDDLMYTVRVTNKSTNCFTDRMFTFEPDTIDIRVLASAMPITSCITDDGELFATVQDGNGNNYVYEWYDGATVSGQPLFTSKAVQTAPLGLFTVVAKDLAHDFCSSIPATVEVKDGRIYPTLNVTEENPVTYCDPNKVNGVARVSIYGPMLSYRFVWYLGTDTTSPFYEGVQVSGLSPVEYIVRATHLLTGCASQGALTIAYEPEQIASPSVVILSHETNCITPDGMLQAIVSGNSSEYDLVWYNGRDEKATPDFTGEYYRNLEAGFYTTIAHHLETGCNSNPVMTEVLPFKEDPEFTVEVTPTTCEQSIGTALYVPSNDVPILDIFWEVGDEQHFGTSISGLPKGTFVVTATSVNQCVTTQSFEILPDILVFNGVSKNGDGKNDKLFISCIEDFPNNQVKIFNRAGTLVYSAKGYNNKDIAFEGTSNEGISILGRELPDGTYFYIVDRGDQSKPLTGYLELRRTDQ